MYIVHLKINALNNEIMKDARKMLEFDSHKQFAKTSVLIVIANAPTF